MADNNDNNDPLEELLDEIGDDQFGSPRFTDHAESDGRTSLKSWSAQDFSNMYVRFYPFVLRQAKRYLTNHSQAEEVTQEAFLYLMTSLPEVDSETGVLKLLKWKTRLLALDVISANSRAAFSPLEDHIDYLSADDDVDEQILRADEAAVVSLALARLQPRHREALIASVYEEKRFAVVGAQMGVTENAARQLLHRARRSFKQALVGEAEIAGLSASKILSIAARKASHESAKLASVASGLILVLALSLGVLPNIGEQSPSLLAAEPSAAESSLGITLAPPESAESVQSKPSASQPEPLVRDETEPVEVVSASDPSTSGPVAVLLISEKETTPPPAFEVRPVISLASVSSYMKLSASQAEVSKGSTAFFPNAVNVLKVHSGIGLWAFLDFDQDLKQINGVALEVMIDGEKYFVSPRSFGASSIEFNGLTTFSYSATELFVISDDRVVFSDQPLVDLFVTLQVQLDSQGLPVGASLDIR
jgi:RNA polymerase sigma-70 factor (ECF subfamily)